MDSKTQQPRRDTDAKGLWAIFWRMLVLAPIVGILGSMTFVLILLVTCAPPLFAVILIFEKHYLLAALCLGMWLAWLRFGGRVRHFVLEGFEHGSL